MNKSRFLKMFVTVICTVSMLTGCGSAVTKSPGSNDQVEYHDHPVITMNAPYRNMSAFMDLVHEKYPEINLKIIPYNGQNTSNYMKNMRLSKQMTDIYFTTYYTPGRFDDAGDFMDLSGFDFTDNYVQSRLRDVTVDGGIYMLPLGYNCIGITYNKTLLEKNGWTLPTNLTELEELKAKVEDAGYIFCRNQLQFPGYGFQYLCNIADTGYLSTIEGLEWQEKFLKGEATVADTPEMVDTLQLLERWRKIGMLNGDGTPYDDNATKDEVVKGRVLFLIGNSNDLTSERTGEDEFRLMPYLSEDGSQNVFILNVSRYVGLNRELEASGNEQKLEDALHVMELLATKEGIQALEPTQNNSRLLPLKGATVDENSYYADVLDDLNSGHTANFIYSGWEEIAPAIGQKMIDYVGGNATLEEVIECFDESQAMLASDAVEAYTTVTETIETQDCARAIGICFAQATGAQAALVSVNEWNYNIDVLAMNDKGVSGCLFPMPVTDEEIVSILPTGWRNNIQLITLSGARIKELAQTGYDAYGNGNMFPYILVTREGTELEDDINYTIPVCGVTDSVMEEGSIQDSGIMGLDAARAYFSQFDTLSAKDIIWE